MRADANVADGDTPLAALMRETAAATVDTILAELRRRPIVYPECVSLQDDRRLYGLLRATVQRLREARLSAEECPVQSQRPAFQA